MDTSKKIRSKVLENVHPVVGKTIQELLIDESFDSFSVIETIECLITDGFLIECQPSCSIYSDKKFIKSSKQI